MSLSESKEHQEYLRQQKEKRKTLKSGEDVMHLSYYENVFTTNELSHFKSEIEKLDLEFSYYNQSGDVNAYLDDYSLDVFFILSQLTLNEILNGTLSNLTWETLKFVVLKGWKKAKDKILTKATPRKATQKRIRFGLKVHFDKNTSFNMHLNGDLNEETILKALDKTFDFIKSQTKNSEYKMSDFVTYYEDKEKWVAIDVLDEILKKRKKKEK